MYNRSNGTNYRSIRRDSKKSSIWVGIFFFSLLSFSNIMHRDPSSHSRSLHSIFREISSLFRPIISLDRIRSSPSLFSLDDSVANESYMLRPSQDYISFLGRKTGSRIASFPDRFQRQMADTRLVHRYGTYSGLLEMAYAAQTSGSREIYFRGDPRRFRRMFHTG